MNRLPETVHNQFNQLFAIIAKASDDLKLAGAEAAISGNFSQVSINIDQCQRLQNLELEIKACLGQFENKIKSANHNERSNHKRSRNRTRKSAGRLRVRVADKVIEGDTIAETFVETLKVFGLDKVAKLNKVVTSIPLMSRHPTSGYQAQRYCNGWHITTHVNQQTASNVLEEIGRELQMPVKVETVERWN